MSLVIRMRSDLAWSARFGGPTKLLIVFQNSHTGYHCPFSACHMETSDWAMQQYPIQPHLPLPCHHHIIMPCHNMDHIDCHVARSYWSTDRSKSAKTRWHMATSGAATSPWHVSPSAPTMCVVHMLTSSIRMLTSSVRMVTHPLLTRLGWPNYDRKYLSIRNFIWRVVCVIRNLVTGSSR